MIIVDRISPAASGLRPRASIAPRTALPIPRPGPIAPRPIASAAPIALAASTPSVPVNPPNTSFLLVQLTANAGIASFPSDDPCRPPLLTGADRLLDPSYQFRLAIRAAGLH